MEHTNIASSDATRVSANEEVIEDFNPNPAASAGEPESNDLNDATIIGEFDPKMLEYLNQPCEFLIGNMYGARDKRNTLDEGWKTSKTTYLGLLNGSAKPVFGLSRHPVAKLKEGSCIVLGSSIGGARKALAMDTMYCMGLDIDSGVALADVVKKLSEKKILSVVYSTFSNGKAGLKLKRDEVLRKLMITTDPTVAQIHDYLREHDKNRYEESFIQQVTISDPKQQTKEGMSIVLDTPPLEKFRLIFPFKKPVKIVDQGKTHQAAINDWEDAVTGVAHALLGIHFDTACTDPSRLFYLPRHPAGAEFHSTIIAGDPLDYTTIPRISKATYNKNRDLNPYVLAEDSRGEAPAQVLTPSGKSLNKWHTRGGKTGFLVASALEDFAPDRVRNAGNESHGSIHLECPFEHQHSKSGGTGTMATDAIDSASGYWTIHCKHDACQGRHKLEFLAEILEQGWLEESILFDDAYNLPPGDDLGPDEDKAEAAQVKARDPTAEVKIKTPDELIEALADGCNEEAIRKVYKRLHRRGLDLVERDRINRLMQKKTKLSLPVLKSFWKDLDVAAKETEKVVGAELLPTVGETGFKDLLNYGRDRISKANADEARVFHYMERLAVIRDDANANAKIKFMDKDAFANLLNTVSDFQREIGEKKFVSCSAPLDVVNHLFSDDLGTYPGLRGLVTSPTFSKSGQLILSEGYHRESSLYYSPNHTLVVPPVSAAPTSAEITEAKRLLIDEVFADFPLGAKTRPEIVEMALGGEGLPAVANLICLTLLPFLRDMINGPTPGHLLTKPAPGTGASLLTDVVSIIATGDVTPAMAMPGNKDEMGKTLTSVLANGQNIVFFDNISHSVDSGELASAMTAKVYAARILGKSQTMNVEVRCAWVLTGNTVRLSNELIRRLVMIDLDTRESSPEKRTGFRHADIRGWVEKHRGRLVWACLTLIQNWIAKGMVEQTDNILASYENWSRVMGGVLRDAGILGFMGNRAKLEMNIDDAASESFEALMRLLAENYQHGQIFRPSGTANYGRLATVSLTATLNEHNDRHRDDPIMIEKGGYEKDHGTGVITYLRSQRLSSALRSINERTFSIGVDDSLYDVRIEGVQDTKNKTLCFLFHKTLKDG